MATKFILLVSAASLLIQTISSQCIRNTLITPSGGFGGLQLGNNNNNAGLTVAGSSNGFAGCNAGNGFAGNGFAANFGSFGSANGLGGCNGGNSYASNLGSTNYASSIGNLASLNGGELLVCSSSPLSPNGLSVVSENSLEGALNVIGSLPFLSAVNLEGQVASGGSAGVSYGCGSGNVGIIGENIGCAGGSGLNYGSGLANTGSAAGLSYGCGNAGLTNAGLSYGYSNNGLSNAGLANYGGASDGLSNYGLTNAGIPDGIVTIGTGCGGLYW